MTVIPKEAHGFFANDCVTVRLHNDREWMPEYRGGVYDPGNHTNEGPS